MQGSLPLLTACAAGTMQCFAASCTGRAGSTHAGLPASAGFRACACAQLASLGLKPAMLPMLAAAGTAQNTLLGVSLLAKVAWPNLGQIGVNGLGCPCTLCH